MTRDRLRAIVIAAAAIAAAVLADAAVAADGTVAGRLGGVVPRGDSGAATLRAIDLGTGRIAGADRLGASGRYAVRLAPGTYLVAGTVVDLAAGAIRSDVTPPVALRPGQRRAAPLALRRRPSRRVKRKRRRARAAYVQEDGTRTPGVAAIRFENFDGATGEMAVMNRGLRVLWETQVVTAADRCPFVLVASAEDMVKVRAEHELQKSPRVDPASRIRRNFVLPDLIVAGALRSRPGGLAFAVRVRDARTGRVVGALSGLIEGEHFFEAADVQGERLVSLLCSLTAPPPPVPPRAPAAAGAASTAPPPPVPPPVPPVPEPALPPDPDPLALAGSFSGDVDYGTLPVAPVPMRLSWQGNVRLERLPYGVLPVVQYRLESGSVTVTLDIDGGEGSGCDVDGTEVIDLAQANPGGLPGVLTVDLSGMSPTYRLTLGATAANVTGVKSGCDDPAEDGGTFDWPLGSNLLAFTIDPQPVTDRFAYTAALSGRPAGPSDPVYHWAWSLAAP